jgi:putative resolvase
MANIYSPREFGQLIGRSVKTLQKWDREGTLTAQRSPTNRRYYTQDQYLAYRGLTATPSGKTVVYARVSHTGEKAELARQVASLRAYCLREGYKPDERIEEIGSGLDYRRKQFNRLVEAIEVGQVRRLIIAHQDRLVRFGFDWFAALCARHGTDLIIINGDTLSPESEVREDLVAIVHDFSARLPGLRPFEKLLQETLRHDDSL